MGRDSSVGVATPYGLAVRGSNAGGAGFYAPAHTCPGAHPASYTVGTGSFSEVKRPGRGVNHPPPPSAEVKERVRAISLMLLCGLMAGYRVKLTLYLFWGILTRELFDDTGTI